jgi:predicted NBD/HSP70 family sugar kinase
LETAVSSAAIRDRYEALGGEATLDVREIIDRIVQGDDRATRVLDEVARCVGAAILAVSAVVDPACVILGGSIGSREELLGRVQDAVAGCMPVPPAIRISRLGSRAGLLGTLAEGLEKLRDELFELDAGPKVMQPSAAGKAAS